MRSDAEAVRRWLNDIRHNIALAEGFVAGMSYAIFKDDLLRLYAVTRCLEIISEASRRLPEELKERHPSIEWRDMQRTVASHFQSTLEQGRGPKVTARLLHTAGSASDYAPLLHKKCLYPVNCRPEASSST